MHFSTTLLLASAALSHTAQAALVSQNSTKRGLVYIPQTFITNPTDEPILTSPETILTWYYNYQMSPSPSLASQTHLEFVPMLWGSPDNANDFSFSDTVQNLIRQGKNITHVMGFNEPDGTFETGGSSMSPIGAAATWRRVLQPLREKGLKLVGPATTGGPQGKVWLAEFLAACGGQCSIDVLPVHWYGDFGGLASHIGEKETFFEGYPEAFPNGNETKIWVTEYAYPHGDFENSQRFFNESAEYFDRLEVIERYSYFGSFRSDRSNVGPYAAMLTEKGELTDIGSLYLGGGLTGRVPDGSVKPENDESGAFSLFGYRMRGWEWVIVAVVGAVVL